LGDAGKPVVSTIPSEDDPIGSKHVKEKIVIIKKYIQLIVTPDGTFDLTFNPNQASVTDQNALT
jgi:hypothetical protein